jgi:putative Mn2+ efflux pump MntP
VSTLELLAVAFGLAMDAFAVSIACSVALGSVSARQVFRLSFHFGLFQALMPLIGWLAGTRLAQSFSTWDHWIAFALLLLVGGKAVLGALGGDDEQDRSDPTRGLTMVSLSIAVSIDALAVGLSFAMLNVTIWSAVIVIGIVAGVMTIIGMRLGSRLGQRFGRQMELTGGLVLVGIGVKILADHILRGPGPMA